MLLRLTSLVGDSIGFWGWYSFAYWASSRIYPVNAEVWWLNQFGFCGLACLAIAAALASGRFSQCVCRILDKVSLIASLAAMLVLGCEPLNDVPEPIIAVAVAAVGFFMAWTVVRWAPRYASMDAKKALLLVLVAVVMISLHKLVSYLLPPVLLAVLNAAVLVAMTAAMRSLSPSSVLRCEREGRIATGKTVLSLWQTLLSIVVFFALWSLLNSSFALAVGHITRSSDYSGLLVISSQTIDIGFSVLMIWWIKFRKRSIDWTLFWQIAYFFLAGALLTISLYGTVQVAQVFLSAAAELVFMFVVYFLTRLSRRCVCAPELVVATGYAFVSIVDWTVRAVVSYSQPGLVEGPLVSVLLFLILSIIVFFLPARSPGMQMLTSELGDIERRSSLDVSRCETLAREYGLSSRELEVLELLCRGRSTPYIAETLYLSENTVKTYRRRIYQKLGVHGKQSLIDLIEGGSS